jgi:hypothetical protein
MSNRSEETPSLITYPMTPSTGLSRSHQRVPPRIPPRVQRTPKPSPSIEQEVPASAETKLSSSVSTRRPPPPPPLPQPAVSHIESSKPNKTRTSRKYSKSNSHADVQHRSSSAVSSRAVPTCVAATATTKRAPLKEEHLLKRSSSADRVGRERWLHHITESSAMDNGLLDAVYEALHPLVSFFLGIKLRTSLPNPLQLVSNHFNAMSKLLSATKYAIEHRAQDTVQLFQVTPLHSQFSRRKTRDFSLYRAT